MESRCSSQQEIIGKYIIIFLPLNLLNINIIISKLYLITLNIIHEITHLIYYYILLIKHTFPLQQHKA